MKKYFVLLLIAILLIFTVSGCTENTPSTSKNNHAGDNQIGNNINQPPSGSGDGITNDVANEINDTEKLDEDLSDPELDNLSEDLKEIDW